MRNKMINQFIPSSSSLTQFSATNLRISFHGICVEWTECKSVKVYLAVGTFLSLLFSFWQNSMDSPTTSILLKEKSTSLLKPFMICSHSNFVFLWCDEDWEYQILFLKFDTFIFIVTHNDQFVDRHDFTQKRAEDDSHKAEKKYFQFNGSFHR